ncbi:MAG: hypothetical protein KGJ80_18375 [Chloroflexota bacterium]|nr:hypothetical protein [Chloroflexota bacterium]
MDTKVFIRRGQNVQITATGSWSHGMEGDTMPYYGAGGYPKIDSNALVPGSNVGMLVGKIGSGPAFAIGASKTLVADNEGTLFLAMNDVPGYFGDNDGTVQGNITVR